MHYACRDYDPTTQTRVMARTTLVDIGDAVGVDSCPRPLGVGGLSGEDMSTVADIDGASPQSYRENTTMVRGLPYFENGHTLRNARSGKAVGAVTSRL